MNYAIAHIVATLKDAREKAGMSQRELSGLAGVPQSHISKIEGGTVDLRLSSLVELARVLDMELILVPRKSVPAVRSIVRSAGRITRSEIRTPGTVAKELERLESSIAAIAGKDPAMIEAAQLRRQIRDLRHLQVPTLYLDQLRKANEAIVIFEERNDKEALSRSLSAVQAIRNDIANSAVDDVATDTVRPAYSLDEEDHGP